MGKELVGDAYVWAHAGSSVDSSHFALLFLFFLLISFSLSLFSFAIFYPFLHNDFKKSNVSKTWRILWCLFSISKMQIRTYSSFLIRHSRQLSPQNPSAALITGPQNLTDSNSQTIAEKNTDNIKSPENDIQITHLCFHCINSRWFEANRWGETNFRSFDGRDGHASRPWDAAWLSYCARYSWRTDRFLG